MPEQPIPAMAATPCASPLAEDLKQRFSDRIQEVSTYRAQDFAVVTADAAVEMVEYLKLEHDFDYLVDLTAVDYPKREQRFDLVYVLYSFSRNERFRVKTRIREGEKAQSAVAVHPAANWLEREVYDMFGIEFAGHPDLKRILLPEDWQGHPLRKEYGITQVDQRWVRENIGIENQN